MTKNDFLIMYNNARYLAQRSKILYGYEYFDAFDRELDICLWLFQTTSDFRTKANNAGLSFASFINFSILHHAKWLTDFDTAQSYFGEFLTKWLRESQANASTFMLTPISDIAINQLVFLDGRYESSAEITAFIQNQIDSGKYLYQNPNTTNPILAYSPAAILLIKALPACRTLIQAHEAELAELASMPLPETFYNALHDYLRTLDQIGQKGDRWYFDDTDDTEVERCLLAKMAFFDEMRTYCDARQQTALTARTISIAVRNSTAPSELKFDDVAHGRGALDCIITQQIYLWAMLKQHRPEVVIPTHLLSHPQGQLFDLGQAAPNEGYTISDALELAFLMAIRILDDHSALRTADFPENHDDISALIAAPPVIADENEATLAPAPAPAQGVAAGLGTTANAPAQAINTVPPLEIDNQRLPRRRRINCAIS